MGTVLVVQPDPVIGAEWAGALTEEGHHVLGAEGIRSALDHVREGGIDLIILDAYEARVGTEIAAALERIPDAPPLVLVSALTNAPELSARIGAAGLVLKPCGPDEIASVVLRVTGSGVRPLIGFEDERTGQIERRHFDGLPD